MITIRISNPLTTSFIRHLQPTYPPSLSSAISNPPTISFFLCSVALPLNYYGVISSSPKFGCLLLCSSSLNKKGSLVKIRRGIEITEALRLQMEVQKRLYEQLERTVASPGRGILAMDESNATCGKHLAAIGLDNTEANGQACRTLLVSAPGQGDYISGAILFEVALYQSTVDGKKIVDVLLEQNIVPGIKVDKIS